MYRHVTPFLKSINTSLSSCSLRDRTNSFIKYASRILLFRVFTGALVSTNQLNSGSMFLAKCFAGSELPLHWSLKVPYKYKWNAITGELHRAKRIASNFDNETKRIRNKYRDAGYPKNVIENTIKNFNSKKDELLIPPWLFDERKHVTIRLWFSSKYGKYCVYFINKLVSFTCGKVKFNVV